MKRSLVMLLSLAPVSACGLTLSSDVNGPPVSLFRDGGIDLAAPRADGDEASRDLCRPCSQQAPAPGMQCVAAACACVNQLCCCR